MTSSLYPDGPPLTSASSPSLCGYPIDTALALSSLSFVINQLSTLLLHAGPPPPTLQPPPSLPHCHALLPCHPTKQPSHLPPTPLLLLPSSSPPCLSLAPHYVSRCHHSTLPHSCRLIAVVSPSAPDAALLPPSLPTASTSSPTISSSASTVSPRAPRHTTRILTEIQIQTLPVPLFPFTVKRWPSGSCARKSRPPFLPTSHPHTPPTSLTPPARTLSSPPTPPSHLVALAATLSHALHLRPRISRLSSVCRPLNPNPRPFLSSHTSHAESCRAARGATPPPPPRRLTPLMPPPPSPPSLSSRGPRPSASTLPSASSSLRPATTPAPC